MIRFLVALLVLVQITFPLVSCTAPAGSEDETESALPIEDDSAQAAAETPAGGSIEDDLGEPPTDNPDQVASTPAKSGGEDDLESEFENDSTAKASPEPTTESAGDELTLDEGGDQPVASNDKIEDELAATNEPMDQTPAPTDEIAAESEPLLDAPDEPVAPKSEKVKIRDIRYLSNASGGTVVIETSAPITYQTRLNAATQQFVVEMAGVELPANLQQPYLTKDFNSRIGSINAYQTAGSDTARVVIQMNGKGGGEPVVQQEGASLVIIPPAAPAVAQQDQPAAKPAPNGENKANNEGALAAQTLDEFLTGNQKFFGRLISLQVKDADVRDVVNFLAEESGANIVMSDDVKGRISLKLRRVPWDQALVTVMRTKEMGYVRQGNVLRISTLKALQSETEAANKIIEAQKAIVPAVVQVMPVNYANLEELVKNVTPFLSKDGRVVADNRTNTIVVTDKTESVDRIGKLIKTLDIPPAQVSIETKIVEAAETFSSFMGINWGFGGSNVQLSGGGGAQGGPISLNLAARSTTLQQDFAGAQPFTSTLGIGTLDLFGDLTATLTLAERNSLAKVISAPRISTMNREKSTIQQKGENISIIRTKSEQTGAVTATEKRTPFSLELNVTPQITADGAVIMDLDVKREFLGAVVDTETGARPINTRSAKTKILVHNGQTAVIGGIYTSDELEATNGVPGLMHIPVIGWLFKNKATDRTKNELLIFLTPRILAQDEAKAQMASSQ